jgi:hypothetical protein
LEVICYLVWFMRRKLSHRITFNSVQVQCYDLSLKKLNILIKAKLLESIQPQVKDTYEYFRTGIIFDWKHFSIFGVCGLKFAENKR